MNSRTEIDCEWLREQYWDEQRPTNDIGSEVGFSGATILNRMRDCGIPCRPLGVYVRTERARENLSKSHIGHPGYWTGKKRSPEDIEKFRKSHLGKKQSEETRRKRMRAISGEKHYNWKGGITPLVRCVRRCFKYRQWRKEIFERDDFTCVLCGERGGWKEADHYPKTFSSIFHGNNIETMEGALDCEEFWDTSNGRTLCKKCHNETK